MVFAVAGVFLISEIVQADFVTDSIAVGTNPISGAGNQLTNKIYVANYGDGTVTAIDCATKAATTITVGTNPRAEAVNPVANKIYVANLGSNNVSVIDGLTNTVTATITTGTNPSAIALNPRTGKVYVANYGSDTVTVINGSNLASSIIVGSGPDAIAVNPVTNLIYVANNGGGSVSVINGSTDQVSATVTAGTNPYAVAVNTVTNTIYVANNGSNNVSIINGSTNQATTVSVGTVPVSVAVNPLTNMIYVANNGSNNVSAINGSTKVVSTVTVGTTPYTVAVNSITNEIYVANYGSNNVSRIDGTTNLATVFSTGNSPRMVVINPVTNRIYSINNGGNNVTVVNGGINKSSVVAGVNTPIGVCVNPVTNKIFISNNASNTVTVIDGATNATSTIAVGNGPHGICVNPVTNKIYVANNGSNSNTVTVIDGATNTTSAIAVGSSPFDVGVNPVTNKIYVVNGSGNNVAVIDGATNTTTTVSVGTTPVRVCVNPVTNKIYVSNNGIGVNSVSVIDGATNTTSTIAVGQYPWGICVNPVTNKIYVANNGASSNVTVIDGATNTTIAIPVAGYPVGISLNPVTNKIYVTNQGGNTMTVIDGATNATYSMPVGSGPSGVCVNPVTNKIYVANFNDNNVTLIDESPASDTKLWAITDTLQFHATTLSTPTITGKAVNRQAVGQTGIWDIGTNVNSLGKVFSSPSITSGAGSDSASWSLAWGTDTLLPGENFICSFMIDSTSGTTNNCGMGSPFSSNVSICPVFRVPQMPLVTAPLLSSPSNSAADQAISLTLSWGAVTGASSYVLQVSTDSNFATTTVYQAGITLPSQSVSGLANYTTYYWTVNAANAVGNGPWSPKWHFRTIAVSPTAPVLISPGNGAIGEVLNPTLSWNAQAGAISYALQVSTASDFSTTIMNQTGISTTSYNVTGLSISTTYYWRVNVTNSVGSGPWATAWNFITAAVPPPSAAPVTFSPATGAVNVLIPALLIWHPAPTATFYRLQISTSADFRSLVKDTTGILDTSISLAGLANNTKYYWCVSAINAGGASGWSVTANFTTIIAVAGAPTLISPASGSVNLPIVLPVIWHSVPTAVSYRLQVSMASNFSTAIKDSAGITDTSLVLSGLINNIQYFWRINATNAGGISIWSSTDSFTTLTPPSVVTLLSPSDTAKIKADSVLLIWNMATPSVMKFFLQVATDSGMAHIFFQDSTLSDTAKLIGSLAANTTYWWRVKAQNAAGWGQYSPKMRFVCPVTAVLPRRFEFRSLSFYGSEHVLRYTLPQKCFVSLKYYDVSGREIASFVNKTQNPGYYSLSLPLSILAKGTYIQLFKAGNFIREDRVAIIR